MSQPPVVIEPYDPSWPTEFENEQKLIEGALGPLLVGSIEHIGSTAVPGLPAKPIIDIMAGVASLRESRPGIALMEAIGYSFFPYKPNQMHWFCKPSDEVRTHHLHLVPYDNELWRERLKFRNLLCSEEALRRDYTELKIRLAAEFREDREAYTEAKGSFIRAALDR